VNRLRRAGKPLRPATAVSGCVGFLTVSEIALSMVLLIGAGLLTRTFVGIAECQAGVRETEHILTAKVTLPKYSLRRFQATG